MSEHHARALALLAESGLRPSPRAVPELEARAAADGVNLPDAYLAWARLDPDGEILGRCSNDDHFFWGGVLDLPNGRRILPFHQENQGNFLAGCLLGAGEDPPVIYGWCERDWMESAPRFSDYVCAQVFDWQLKIRRDDEDDVIDLFYDTLPLRSAAGLDAIAARFEEFPATAWTVGEPTLARARRFRHPVGARAAATFEDQGGEVYFGGARCAIEISGPDDDAIAGFEEALLALVGADAMPPIYFSPHKPEGLLRALERRISAGHPLRLKHFAAEPLTDAVVDRLLERAGAPAFKPDDAHGLFREPSDPWIGGPNWGVRIKLAAVRGNWIAAERIELA